MKLSNMFLKKKFLYFGFHIGQCISNTHCDFKYNNQFVEGLRNSYSILNLNFSIFFIQKSFFFLKSLNKNFCNMLFAYSSLDENLDSNLIMKKFLKKKLFFKTGVSFVYLKWIPGLISNYNFCFLRFIKFIIKKISLLKHTVKNRYKKQSFHKSFSKLDNLNLFSTLFFKLFFLLEEEMILDEKLNLNVEFKKNSHLFRLVVFLRFWKSFFWVPDLLLAINFEKDSSILDEFAVLKIPVISSSDSINQHTSISYPLLLNYKTRLGNIFLISLFINNVKHQRVRSLVSNRY